MSLGPFLFLQPWALLGLIALPLLWLLLRATPPEPKRFALPSLALLDDLKPEEETPARTPWWLLLLRMIALALAILGFARPTWAPNAQVNTIGELLQKSVDDLLTVTNFGQKSLDEVIEKLVERGLSLKQRD